VGTLLREGRYRLLRVLGRGGFGITYEADDARLHRRVAIKELFPESVVRHGTMALAAPEARAAFRDAKGRFLGEAQVLARFDHPGIVRAYEVFEAHNTAYLVMELIEGRTLADLLREHGPMPEAQAVSVAARVAPALEAVHDAGVLHRDVNPSNIVLTPTGRVVVIDFGIARRYDGSTTGPLTRMVTPGYSPPEQYAEAAALDVSSDVYGLAATLYRLLTGTAPTSALDRQQGRRLAAPRELRPDLSKDVSDAVLDGLELDPRHRPQSMRAFVRRLGVAVPEPGDARTELAGPAGVVDGHTEAAPVRDAHVPPPAPALNQSAPPPPAPVLVPPVAVAPPVAVGPPMAGQPGAPPVAAAPVAGWGVPGRWKVTLPVAVAAVALSSASVVPVSGLLALVALPLLATLGDLVVHDHRLRTGQASRRWHQWPHSTVAPLRAVRNLGVALGWAVPGLAMAGVTIVAGVLTDSPRWSTLHDVLVRVGGALAGCLLLWACAKGGPTFQSGLGVDRAAGRFVDQRGKLLQAGWVLWIVAIGVTAFGLWLSPEVWPFGR
jgi:hypothetical protein